MSGGFVASDEVVKVSGGPNVPSTNDSRGL